MKLVVLLLCLMPHTASAIKCSVCTGRDGSYCRDVLPKPKQCESTDRFCSVIATFEETGKPREVFRDCSKYDFDAKCIKTDGIIVCRKGCQTDECNSEAVDNPKDVIDGGDPPPEHIQCVQCVPGLNGNINCLRNLPKPENCSISERYCAVILTFDKNRVKETAIRSCSENKIDTKCGKGVDGTVTCQTGCMTDGCNTQDPTYQEPTDERLCVQCDSSSSIAGDCVNSLPEALFCKTDEKYCTAVVEFNADKKIVRAFRECSKNSVDEECWYAGPLLICQKSCNSDGCNVKTPEYPKKLPDRKIKCISCVSGIGDYDCVDTFPPAEYCETGENFCLVYAELENDTNIPFVERGCTKNSIHKRCWKLDKKSVCHATCERNGCNDFDFFEDFTLNMATLAVPSIVLTSVLSLFLRFV